MSSGWRGGSTHRWRVLRLAVLIRDEWTCQLCGEGIDPSLTSPHPRSAEVHHTRGKAAGDALEYLVASHRECNAAAGDPNRDDPRPVSITEWS